jgi:MoxR-like ATPase/HEAT repeat protein
MKKSASIDVLQHSQTTEDRFSDELGALVAHVYLKLKQDFPELFTIRDLKRATEALTLFLESGLSEKDAFVDMCHYAFTQIQPESDGIVRSILEQDEDIKAVLPDFEPRDLTSLVPRLPALVTSISAGLNSFLQVLVTHSESPTVKTLLNMLNDMASATNKPTRITARKIAYDLLFDDSLRDVILEELEGDLTDAVWTVRQGAVVVLASLFCDRVREGKQIDLYLLETMLKDDAWAVRQATVEALSNIYPTLIRRNVDVDLNGLEAALQDRSWLVRKATVSALSRVYAARIERGIPADVTPLERLLSDHDTGVRRAALGALGDVYTLLIKRGGDVDIAALEVHAANHDEKVQMALINALGSVYVALLDREVVSSLSKIERGISSEFLGVRKTAAVVLSVAYPAFIRHGVAINLEQIEMGLDGLIDYIRQATIEALGIIYPALIEVGAEVDLPRLETGLNDEYWAVRQATVEALSNIYPTLIRRNVDVDLNGLEAALQDRSWVVRKATVSALSRVYAARIERGIPTDISLLLHILSEPNDEIRRVSTEALSRVYAARIERGIPTDVSPLERLLTDHDTEVRQATIEAFGLIYPVLLRTTTSAVRVRKLEKTTHHKHAATRIAAAKALGDVYAARIERGKELDITPLEQLLGDNDSGVRRTAVKALERVYPRYVDKGRSLNLHVLEQALDDNAADVRRDAQNLFRSVARALLLESDERGFEETIRELGEELSASLSAPLSGAYLPYVQLKGHSLYVGHLSIQKKTLQTSAQQCIVTKAAYEMLSAIASAFLLRHPLLLMGPTSTGKSFLIKWLAETLGYEHISYTLNPYVSKSELIGGIKPNNQGKFVWQDGIVLKAAKRGTWLVLEELNLATSEVLEILNDYLITGKFTYSENGDQRVVEPSGEFRLFATANPSSYAQRERLSQVFVSRFKVQYQRELREEDLIEILSGLFGIPVHLAYSIAFFHVTLQEQADSKVIGKEEKEPYIFSLRDLIRLGRRLSPAIKTNVPEPMFMHLLGIELADVYVARVRHRDEREGLVTLIDTIFGTKAESSSIEEALTIPSKRLEQLLADLPVTRGRHFIPGEEARIVPTETQRNTLVSVLKALKFDEPILLVGYPASGKTTLVRYLAREKKTDLYYVNLSSDSSLEELLGGFTQDRSGKWRYKRGLLFKAVKNGAWLLIDEANLNPLSEYLNTLLDFGYITDEEGTIFELHPNFRLFFSINPPKIHPSRNVLSPALRTRFNEIWIEEITDVAELSELVDRWKRASPSA